MRQLTLHPVNSTVVSVFAIFILGIVGGLYRSGHEEFVGGREDPDDGKAVSSTIFTAVIVYAVRIYPFLILADISKLTRWIGLSGILRLPGHASCPREPTRRDRLVK